jgi:hypothetical protein
MNQGVRQESSANASRGTRSLRADSGFASTRVATKTSGRLAPPIRDNFMAPEGAARGPVRYATVFRMRLPLSVFLSSALHTAHRSPRSNREEDTSRGGTRGAARQHVASASFLARGVSRVRLDRPAIPTTRTTPNPDRCRFSSASARARGRHATARGAFLNFDTGAAVRCASNVRFFLILTGSSRDKTSRSPA